MTSTQLKSGKSHTKENMRIIGRSQETIHLYKCLLSNPKTIVPVWNVIMIMTAVERLDRALQFVQKNTGL